MRYKFRGKRLDNGEWVYGDLLNRRIWSRRISIIRMIDDGFDTYQEAEVLPESVGQWTGLVDRHGTEIYEGDVIRFTRNTGPIYKPTISSDVCIVRWIEEKSSFRLCYKTQQQKFHAACSNKYEIIGNIHDNPELMEVE